MLTTRKRDDDDGDDDDYVVTFLVYCVLPFSDCWCLRFSFIAADIVHLTYVCIIIRAVLNILFVFCSAQIVGWITYSYFPKSLTPLTHCCAWPAEGRSVLYIERSWPTIRAAPTDRLMSSSNCCSQFLRGRPGGRLQSAVGGVPVWASIDSCSACEAGVFSGRRQMYIHYTKK